MAFAEISSWWWWSVECSVQCSHSVCVCFEYANILDVGFYETFLLHFFSAFSRLFFCWLFSSVSRAFSVVIHRMCARRLSRVWLSKINKQLHDSVSSTWLTFNLNNNLCDETQKLKERSWLIMHIWSGNSSSEDVCLTSLLSVSWVMHMKVELLNWNSSLTNKESAPIINK